MSISHYTVDEWLNIYVSSCCLAGRAYPLGDIPDDLIVPVKEQVNYNVHDARMYILISESIEFSNNTSMLTCECNRIIIQLFRCSPV